MKIRRILLVLPNYQGAKPGKYKPLFPPLALMQLAALTPPEIEIKVVDESIKPIDFELPTDLVGISVTMSASRPRADVIAAGFQKSGVPVVYGGVDATFNKTGEEHADYIFKYEAEAGWQEFLDQLRNSHPDKIFIPQEKFSDITDIPAPKRDSFSPRDYTFFNIVQTARGCPNCCDFCSVWLFSGRKMRFRAIPRVIEEIKSLPAGEIIFADDNIISDFDRAEELFKALRPLKRTWFAQADTTLIERPDLVKLASQSGCNVLFVGLESFNQESLGSVNKGFNKSQRYQELVKLLHCHGITIIPAMIFGLDPDKFSTLLETEKKLNDLKADAPQFSVLTPLPGTKLYQQMYKQGRITNNDLSCYDGTRVVFQTKEIEPVALEQGIRELYRRYYRPGAILWRLITDPWFWRHPGRRLKPFFSLLKHFAPRIKNWAKKAYKLR